jgi:hypothetical protein
MTRHIFYHSRDLDGHCSGAIARRNCLTRHEFFRMYPTDYGETLDLGGIRSQDVVSFLDFVPDDHKVLDTIDKIGCMIEIIDHHSTSLPLVGIYPGKIEVGRAACELAWEWYEGGSIPRVVTLLGLYDTWRGSGDKAHWEDFVLPLQYGLRIEETDPSTSAGFYLWRDLFAFRGCGMENEYINAGKTVLKYQRQLDKKACRRSFETGFYGFRAIVKFGGLGSLSFASVYDPSKHDVMVSIDNVQGEYWTVSLYADKPEVDILGIAKEHGGGGHRMACGFQVNNLNELFPNNPCF